MSLIGFTSLVFAETTSIPGLYRYKLDNGLELFVAENDAAPLAYIEIAVRAGAVTQTPETTGLFHLYEHMMFKGNEKYANQEEFTNGANELGQIDQNGSTGIQRVNYYFTIPSYLVREGLEFWSYAVRTPKIDDQELENEKAVVVSEINATFTNPSRIKTAAIFKQMFPEAPWRTDYAGSPSIIRGATPDILREIQKNYYVPENSAIFVGGNVNHDDVFSAAYEIFSDWQNPETPVPFEAPEVHEFQADKKFVFVDPGASSDFIDASYCLRGPDGETDAADTYSADVWLKLANNPNGIFANTFTSDPIIGIPKSDYVGASYPTTRATSMVIFFASMLNSNAEPETESYGIGKVHPYKKENLNSVDKAEYFLSVLKEKAIPAMTDRYEFFKSMDISFVKTQLEDSRVYQLESAKAILSALSYVWSTCGSDYFFSYDQNISNVTEHDVTEFVRKYFVDKNGIFVVSVSPEIWEKYKAQFLARGYEQITAENAFWHRSAEKSSDE